MAPSAASGVSSLPSGFAVFTTFPDLLFIFEFVFGGLVWILISSSHVPIPLIQGWVMFASVFCFVATTILAFLYVIGAHGNRTSWITLDAAYHSVAALFYFGASVLEALATIQLQDGFYYKFYHENISAVVTWDNQSARLSTWYPGRFDTCRKFNFQDVLQLIYSQGEPGRRKTPRDTMGQDVPTTLGALCCSKLFIQSLSPHDNPVWWTLFR